LQSAAPQVCNLLGRRCPNLLEYAGRPADYQSALRQITNRRYEVAAPAR